MENYVITIGRQYGSGGREIGKQLAKLLGIAYYDRELIVEAACNSGMCAEYFEKADEKLPSTFANALSVCFGYEGAMSPQTIFNFQSEAIFKVARQGSCVIVGRCADYILRNEPQCVSVFIHAPIEYRVERVMSRNERTSDRKARELIEKSIKHRSEYYNFFTEKRWGDASSYDLSIDSSKLGVDRTVHFIRDFVLSTMLE